MSSFYKLSIKEIIKETADAVSILFNVPDELKSYYQFVAGQYVNLKITLDGQEIRRAYSICKKQKRLMRSRKRRKYLSITRARGKPRTGLAKE